MDNIAGHRPAVKIHFQFLQTVSTFPFYCSAVRSQLFLLGDEPQLAFEDILEVLKDDPEDFSAICAKARCLFTMGEFEKSLMVWHQARKMRSNVLEVEI